MTRLFSFRFDVDTHRCVREGMPALSALGRRLDAPFTFFVNMGRAVSRRAVLSRLTGARPSVRSGAGAQGTGTSREPVAAKLGTVRKLGRRGWLEAALLNPSVGAGAPGVLRAARDAGHEIGLHGGRNHATWQAEARAWAPERVTDEIDAVLPGLERILGATPTGFASPGWTSPTCLPGVLAARGFAYVADEHGPGGGTAGAVPGEAAEGLRTVRTALTGEPGGVAYLEHLRARGMDDARLLRRFEEDLADAEDRVAVYDHPYWAGIRELDMLERMVEAVRSAGYDVVPLAVLAGVR